jgi:threonine dehydratase
MAIMTELVSLAEIRAAAAELEGIVRRTPLEPSRDPMLPHVHLKCENLQRAGSFKIRGAAVRIARLDAEERARGVVAASAGNHAQGVALAARQHGIGARIYMPEGAPIPKERATKAYGAEVVFVDGQIEEVLDAARRDAEENGRVFVHPFDHPDIIAGQGTLGLEILEQCPQAATVLVPTGGGGLLAGVAVACKEHRPDLRVVGVQAEEAAAWAGSLEAGHPIRLDRMSTMADGIAVGEPGRVTFDLVAELVDDMVTVSEEAISRALLMLVEREKLVVEAAGAVAVAALAEGSGSYDGPVVAVLSGGNIDPLLLGKVIRHGMTAERRYLNLQVKLADVPGGLARLLGEIGDAGANVLEIIHERHSPGLHLGEVDVYLHLETRGAEHSDAVLARLAEHGYVVEDR